MAFHKILSFGDVVATALVILYAVKFFPAVTLRFVAYYLLLKGSVFLLFSRDFASIVDVLFGVFFLAVSSGFYANNLLTIIGGVWLLQKGIMGLL